MTHLPEKKGFALFNRRKHLEYPELSGGFFLNIRNVNMLYLGSALLQIITGLFAVGLTILQLIQPVWVAMVMGILGSIMTVAGFGLLYYILKRRGSVHELVKATIERVIRDHN